LKIRSADIPSLRVTVMGLGLHGGGLASALFFAHRGARVTVTDSRRDSGVFEPLLPRLREAGVRTVLGRHERKDFIQTDLVVKNPAVPPSSQFLAVARERGIPVETDLSVFLQLCSNRLIAVTGSKGKSTTAAAVHFCLSESYPGARLGGNITVNPLSFLEEIDPEDPIVLELSSWQLADLKGKELLAPEVAVMTVILPDHMDRYPDMDSYIADKKEIFSAQRPEQYALFNHQDPWQRGLEAQSRAQARYFSTAALPGHLEGAYLRVRGAVIRERGREFTLRLDPLSVPGEHNRLNLLAAALACRCFGLEARSLASRLRRFPGIEHRLEPLGEVCGVRYFNDSAATIPEATAAALRALEKPIVLITGGTDKNLDFRCLAEAIDLAEAVVLLRGSATEKIAALLEARGIAFLGPAANLEQALELARGRAAPGGSVLFSPGSASFELFLNEFDRGRQFKKLVQALRKDGDQV
jgi:UDP-N-acetylmuramoylalanine--D-glutamate ligase